MALNQRRQQPEREHLSRRIVGAFMALPEFAVAETVLFYVGIRTEVQTQIDLAIALERRKTIVVPWCTDGGELSLFRLSTMDELVPGSFGIPEPHPALRQQSDRMVAVDELDLIMVPGVAFDIDGSRIGYGQGYFDRLLSRARPDTPFIGLAFECQIFPEIPRNEHDVPMDRIITEDRVCSARRFSR